VGKPVNDLKGKKIGRLTVVERRENSNAGKARWYCVCECGGSTVCVGSSLLSGNTTSCGCRQRTVNLIHGCATKGSPGHVLYTAYRNAWNRCNQKNDPDYANYGGSGIKWLFTSFQEFKDDIGEKPTPLHSLDRIDSTSDYCVGNVKWSLAEEQTLNQRTLTLRNTSGYRGVSKATGGYWQANVRFENVQHYLGSRHKTAEDAARAYDRGALYYHGTLARLNFPLERVA